MSRKEAIRSRPWTSFASEAANDIRTCPSAPKALPATRATCSRSRSASHHCPLVAIPAACMQAAGIATSGQWCEALLEREHVALVAGSAFGAEGHVRMSFAASEAKLVQGLDRIASFLDTAGG